MHFKLPIFSHRLIQPAQQVFPREVRLETWDKSKKKMTGEGEGKEGTACPQTPRF